MAESMSMLYQEVCVASTAPSRWKEILINTGTSTSTLQDIKVAESCGGYTYEDSGVPGSCVRNRYIYWRTYEDVLELVEDSLDVNLSGNYVRYRFHSTPILDGITVHEVDSHVVILVATVTSVHRLVFPHPDTTNKIDWSHTMDAPCLSIFYDVSYSSCTDSRNTFLLLPSPSISTHLTTAATYIDTSGEALFALSAETGGATLVTMPALGAPGTIVQTDLNQSSMMKKLWTGWVPTMIRGRQSNPETPYSLIINSLRGQALLFTVCHDHHLRIWSTKTKECILVKNVSDWIPNHSSSESNIGSSGHKIKPFYSTGNVSLFRLCLHLNFTDRNCFVLVEPTFENGKYQLTHLKTIYAAHEDLVDYSVCSDTLFTLWTNTSGESIARVYQLNSEGEQWVDVILQPSETNEFCLSSHLDPRDVFLEKIFYPGQFSMTHILKALNVYRRYKENNVQADCSVKMRELKEDVTNAVEAEIRESAMEYEINEEEYCQIQFEQWSKFYSCCLQYKEVGSKMKGLFTDNVTGFVCLIKKESCSYLRQCEKLEQVIHLSEEQLPYLELDVQDEDEAWLVQQDVKKLCDCIERIDEEISTEHAQQFYSRLLLLDDPHELAENLVDLVYFVEGSGVCTTSCQLLGLRVQDINNIVVAMETLLRLLDVNQKEADAHIVMEESVEDEDRNRACNWLYYSQTGSGVLLQCLQQTASCRLNVCRNLLLLSHLLLKFSEQHLYGVDYDTALHIRSTSVPDLVVLMKNYVVLYHFSHAVAMPTQHNALEMNRRQLSILQIADTPHLPASKDGGNTTLFELFLHGIGGKYSRAVLGQSSSVNVETTSVWSDLLLPLSAIQTRLLWPMNEDFVFAEFLVGSCQYLWLQEYIRLTKSWCNVNVAARHFLLGLTYLHFDEGHKAAECFVRAADGVGDDDFLSQQLLQIDEESSPELLYYLKVIRQFEEFDLPDLVIKLADMAINIAHDEDANLPTLWSKKFKYHLELNHNEEAYSAMIGNPDPSRRKDCLRQLLIVLCERGDLKTLVNFPFSGLTEEVVNILETRARSVDLTTHNYYNLLFSFHVDRNNYRKAGCIMYEHGMRLGREVPGIKGLQHQARCYLATLNALRLGKKEYAWIVKPITNTHTEKTGKHDLHGEEKDRPGKKVEILEVSDIEKEYMLVDARLRLVHKTDDPTLLSGPTPRAEEMVGHLVNAGFFDRAVIVCRRFNLPLNSVFENLALRCVYLAQSCASFNPEHDMASEAWDWLKENYSVSGSSSKERGAVEEAWQLLQYYLECYEVENGKYHRCVAERLLSHGFPLPTWFLNSYRSLNAAELLRLYINYDLLEEAGNLVLEFVEARTESLSGVDNQRYNLAGTVHPQAGLSWLPYTSIDQLLSALRDQGGWSHKKLYEDLQAKMNTYFNKIDWLSREIQVT